MTNPPKIKRQRREPRNPFDCPGWRRFIMAAIERDQEAARRAAARVNPDGETLH